MKHCAFALFEVHLTDGIVMYLKADANINLVKV